MNTKGNYLPLYTIALTTISLSTISNLLKSPKM